MENTAIDKLRNIIAWADWQDEHFNSRVKTVSDWEKLYDYCRDSDLAEFLDNLSDLTDKEYNKVKNDLVKLLGYDLFV